MPARATILSTVTATCFLPSSMILRPTLSLWRSAAVRFMSTATETKVYPFSKTALIAPKPEMAPIQQRRLALGKGLMPYLNTTLPTPEKQKLLSTLFNRRHPDRLIPGSVLTVTLSQAPTTFSGVLLSIRRRGPDTSFLLRNIVQRTGIEMHFAVCSPHLLDIKVVHKPVRGAGRTGRRIRRAKLFYLRDSPEKMSMISAGFKNQT